MKNLLIAFLIVLTGAAISFTVLSVFEVQKEIAGSISGIFFGGISFVHQILEKRSIKPNISALPNHIVNLEGFGLSPVTMTIYGSLMLFALANIGSMIGGSIAALSNIDLGLPTLFISALFVFPSSYIMGHWIGSRCLSHGIRTTLSVIFIFRLVASIIDSSYLSNEDYLSIYGETNSVGFFLQQIASGLVILGIISLIGYWRGRKKRLLRYVGFLLNFLPNDTRNDLIQLAYEEVKSTLEKNKEA